MVPFTSSPTIVRDIRHAHLFCGIGGGAIGFQKARVRVGPMQGRFVCAGGIGRGARRAGASVALASVDAGAALPAPAPGLRARPRPARPPRLEAPARRGTLAALAGAEALSGSADAGAAAPSTATGAAVWSGMGTWSVIGV